MFIRDQYPESDQLRLMFQAVESARNGVVITDPNLPDNPIIYTNPAFTDITGYDAEDILGKNCRFLQGDDRNQPGLEEVRNAIRDRKAITVVLRNYRKNGTKFYNELTISPVLNATGELVSFVGIQNDISARIEAENRISDFYSIVSHELRTPITKMKSSLSVVIDGEAGPVSAKVRRFLEISAKSADALWKMIENILDFKKLESGQFRLLTQRLPIGNLVENTVAEFKPVANEAGIALSFEGTDNPYGEVDGARIVQVVENLLSNAIKFSERNTSVVVRVLVPDQDVVRVEVCDQGHGIAAEDQSKLFERFQQLYSPDRRLRGGTGLGLSISKAIIEAHGGTIGVESEAGKGSTFWFELKASR